MNRTVQAFAFVLLAFIATSGELIARGHGKWAWNSKLPAQLKTDAKSDNRAPADLDKFFRGPPRPPTLQQVLDFLGPPEAFSPQFMHSKTEGITRSKEAGGTLRFLLDDGTEAHVWTPDFISVGLAVRYNRKGRPHLLYK